MTGNPLPPPEAALIRTRRTALIPELPMRQAAQRAGFSPALWAKIEHGYDQVAPGVVVPYKGTPGKVARMAAVVGITPAELAACGRPDAARHLASFGVRPPAAEPQTYEEAITELRQVRARLREWQQQGGTTPPIQKDNDDEEERTTRRAAGG